MIFLPSISQWFGFFFLVNRKIYMYPIHVVRNVEGTNEIYKDITRLLIKVTTFL